MNTEQLKRAQSEMRTKHWREQLRDEQLREQQQIETVMKELQAWDREHRNDEGVKVDSGETRFNPKEKKECRKCKLVKSVLAFNRLGRNSANLQSWCRKCQLTVMRAARLRKKYGIDPARVDAMLKEQEGRCKLCPTRLTAKTINVDHCHKTGAVRGLLCGSCNRGLGLLKEDPDILIKAAEYLRSASGV